MATNSENTDSPEGRLRRLWSGIEKTRKMVRQLSEVFPSAKAYLAGAPEAWNLRMQSEMQLAVVMQRRMQASQAEVGSIHRLTAAQQSLGVVGSRCSFRAHSRRRRRSGAGRVAKRSSPP